MTVIELMADAPYFIRWGVVQISLPNFLVVVVMVVIFVLALLLPFPSGHDVEVTREADHDDH